MDGVGADLKRDLYEHVRRVAHHETAVNILLLLLLPLLTITSLTYNTAKCRIFNMTLYYYDDGQYT